MALALLITLEVISQLHHLFSSVSSACTQIFSVHQMLLENTREDYQVIQLTLYHDL